MRTGVRVGVDVGDARVGVAACDPEGVLATPVATLTRDAEGGQDQRDIAALAAELNAIEIVVGLPRSLDGTEGPAARSVRAWGDGLRPLIGDTPIRLVDERLTTVDAHRGLRASGVATIDHRRVVDQAAAVLILQHALDSERTSGRPPGERIGGARRRKPRAKGGSR
ncbi:Holliday junction resolvase RuvX [Janibacter sp. GXQ6167]|uniref:Holliday junction resolvase RuvX n=1 Tax=Janibacter sp. GXQ6167 TaxID=3240791 RepID=UPI0035233CD0